MTVTVNPPKTPVTQGSGDIAAATLPNVCKMPGPPAPFVPTPLPNIGKSGNRLKKFTTKVLFEGKKVAVKGSYYMSIGDIASKGTGGGLLNGSTHGKTEFTAPGSMNVKAQGKNIQLLGDAMTNNGNSTNTGATLPGNIQSPQSLAQLEAAVGKENAAALCKAACKAMDEKKTSKPTAKTQNLMRKALDPPPRGQGGGLSKGLPSQVLTEVSQVVGRAGPFVGRWGSAVKAATQICAKWDIILVRAGTTIGPKGLSGFSQIKKIVEVKFPRDSPTTNQTKMMKSLSKSDRKKIVVMDVEKCCMPCP